MKKWCVVLCLCFFALSAYADEVGVVTLSPPKVLPAFALKSAEGKAFGLVQLQQKWSLLFFGFTRCQMICPATMSIIKQSEALLPKNKKNNLRVIFVSIDDVYDTPKKTDDYAKSFNPNFMGVSGKADQVALLTHALGVLSMHVKQNGVDTIDHSANLFLLNPQGQVVAVFSPPYEAKSLAKEIAKIV